MKDDTKERRRRELIPRIALLACLALVVASLGMALNPVSPKEPVAPPFSEQARSAALTETLRLRAAGEEIGPATAGSGQPALTRTVSLLTSQARALLVPGQDGTDRLPSPAPPPASPAAAPASQPAAPLPATAAALATELAASASQRLADAAVADGGMARLLAAVGTAQLLQASSLAASVGAPAPAVPDPAVPDPAAPALSGACPSAQASPSPAPAGAAAGASGGASADASARQDSAATLPAALAATVQTELVTVYGYQVALTRVGGDVAATASQQLARHEALAGDAEALARAHCVPVPPREAGYAMAPAFLASPVAGLGRLEASAMAAYGDLVALSEGQTRQWAISGLVGAARRSALWGAETGVLPGLPADPDGFPELPAASARPQP
ncbi:MAG: ferritin-like domain-containing protein [Arthrobacter sp.]